jgi:hypothetical protein
MIFLFLLEKKHHYLSETEPIHLNGIGLTTAIFQHSTNQATMISIQARQCGKRVSTQRSGGKSGAVILAYDLVP